MQFPGVGRCVRQRPKCSIHAVVDGQRAFLLRKGRDRDCAQILQATYMGAATAIGGQFTKTDFPRTFAQRGQAGQIVLDPLADAALNGLGVDFLRGITGFELHATFIRQWWALIGVQPSA